MFELKKTRIDIFRRSVQFSARELPSETISCILGWRLYQKPPVSSWSLQNAISIKIGSIWIGHETTIRRLEIYGNSFCDSQAFKTLEFVDFNVAEIMRFLYCQVLLHPAWPFQVKQLFPKVSSGNLIPEALLWLIGCFITIHRLQLERVLFWYGHHPKMLEMVSDRSSRWKLDRSSQNFNARFSWFEQM